MKVIVVDGQGGGMGKAIVAQLRKRFPEMNILAVGTNSIATSAMMKAGATAGATGENAAVVNAARAEILAGPIGLVMANSMLGECSPAIACAVAESRAQKVLIPVSKCGAWIAGLPEKPLAAYISDAVALILELLKQ